MRAGTLTHGAKKEKLESGHAHSARIIVRVHPTARAQNHEAIRREGTILMKIRRPLGNPAVVAAAVHPEIRIKRPHRAPGARPFIMDLIDDLRPPGEVRGQTPEHPAPGDMSVQDRRRGRNRSEKRSKKQNPRTRNPPKIHRKECCARNRGFSSEKIYFGSRINRNPRVGPFLTLRPWAGS